MNADAGTDGAAIAVTGAAAHRGGSQLQRRRFLRRLGGLGGATVAAIAVTWADAPAAFAAPYCCDLRYPNGPWCGNTHPNSNFTCPSGYYKRVWYCTYGQVFLSCYECAAGSSCWNGPWYCSNYTISQH
jgi:hypothetical protein